MKKKSILFLFLLLVGCSTTGSLSSLISSSISNSNGSSAGSSTNTNNTSASSSSSSSSSSTSKNSTIISHDPYEGEYYKSIDASKTGLALRSDLAKLITETVKVVEINKNNPDGIIATKEPNVTSNTLIIESIVK